MNLTLAIPSTMRTFGALLVAVVLFGITPAYAGGKVNTGYFGNVAIKGYDPVAYFTLGEATKGSETHKHKWLGAYWHFSSAENKALFAASPQSYAPQYGGHCATGMAVHGGMTTDIDPEAWAIIDDKLYLNYSKVTHNLMQSGKVTVEQADKNWKNPKKKSH